MLRLGKRACQSARGRPGASADDTPADFKVIYPRLPRRYTHLSSTSTSSPAPSRQPWLTLQRLGQKPAGRPFSLAEATVSPASPPPVVERMVQHT